jgi:hypothetical protein
MGTLKMQTLDAWEGPTHEQQMRVHRSVHAIWMWGNTLLEEQGASTTTSASLTSHATINYQQH